jgi:hypothetical protein
VHSRDGAWLTFGAEALAHRRNQRIGNRMAGAGAAYHECVIATHEFRNLGGRNYTHRFPFLPHLP